MNTTGIRIQPLSAAVANQIAAGEVIERPASVVKELLENALDAGATQISIEIGYGGLNQIKISDNGMGIVEDDLPLAIAAHATSKITNINDLYLISSMGFRGEALASIASVSRLSLYSKSQNQEHAMVLHAENGVYHVMPCARTQGTTIDVRDLFFNTPVRKKFLKTERIEYQAIELVIKRFALSEPTIALTLKHNDKPMLTLPAANCEQTKLARIKKIFGKVFIEQSIYLDTERAGMQLQGFVSRETFQRSQSDKQWIYLNRRMVKDKLLQHAIKKAYEAVLHPGRYPTCLLYLNLPADEVDVNVHPTKHEVRFQQPRLVHDFLTSQITQALHPTTLTVSEPAKPYQTSLLPENETLSVMSSTMTPVSMSPSNYLTPLNAQFAIASCIQNTAYLVDLQALQQQQLKTMLNEQTLPLQARSLLVPVIFTIEKSNYQLLESYQSILLELGIQFDFISNDTIRVRSIPVCLPTTNLVELFERLQHTMPDYANTCKLLLASQSFDAMQLTSDDKLILAHYFQTHFAELQTLSRPLDTTHCRDFLYG